MGGTTGGAGERVRSYLRWPRRGTGTRLTTWAIVVVAVAGGVLYAALTALWDATIGDDEVELSSTVFDAVFYAVLMAILMALAQRRAPAQASPGP